MAHYPIWRPDSGKSVPAGPVPSEAAPEEFQPPPVGPGIENSGRERQESDFAEVAAKFATHGRGKIPPGLSGELALDIVLNEIVEQACLATGATGAAIALARDGEMVCRASTGGNAPELGTPLDMNSGLSGACLRSRQIQRCDDTLTDPNVDAEASRELGIRSVVVLPLLRGEDSLGIFEVFSARVAAFGERDLRTLEVLTDRILKNIQARKSSLDALELAPTSVGEMLQAGAETEIAETEIAKKELGETAETGPEPGETQASNQELETAHSEAENAPVTFRTFRRFDWVSALMCGIVAGMALLMGTAFAIRMGWMKAGGQHHATRVSAAVSSSPAARANGKQTTTGPNLPQPKTLTGQNRATINEIASRPETGHLPEGSLRVYENGREIFSMPPSGTDATGTASAGDSASSILQPASIVELSPDAAEGNLLRRVEPEYPEQALAQHVQGPVLLDLHIGQDGTVQEVKVVSGDAQLAAAAATAVRQWRFKPQLVHGRPVEMETQITLKFTLPSS
ncbi:MAG: TonB family protein [Candidatus Sulfotelmatobacter sp.]